MTVGLVLFLLLLPFHLVIKRLVPGPIGTYWKEGVLGLVVALWGIRCIQKRRIHLTGTPLDRAVLITLGLLILRFFLDGAGLVEAWGLYASAMYLPLFWVVPTLLRSYEERHPDAYPRWVTVLIALLVGVGAVVALGGLVEFVLDVALWPSEELVQRQGFPDMYIYGTHIRRVYFTFDSPATLANTLGLLLPLALALVMTVRRTWLRAMAGLAGVLMAACIVVTFSRGIWVATVFSLLVMGFLSVVYDSSGKGFLRRNWRILLAAVGALAVIIVVWGLVAVLRPREAAAEETVVELSPSAYRSIPITDVSQNLLQAEPIHGEVVTQTWTLPDPINGGQDTRTVLYEHPEEGSKVEIVYRVQVPEAGALRCGIALSPEVWSPEKGDGASFQVYVAEPDAPTEGEFALVRYINPKQNPSDRRWRNFVLDLSPWSGQTVRLSFITEEGPAGSWSYDWAGWAEPQVISVESGFFASAQTENAVLRHTGSILDWARDATNRDRLAAWNLALNAWREAPLWGQGLGTTGIAALRTMPERAFVTESQVLKALVELGLPGLLVFAYLWFEIARVGLQAYGSAADSNRLLLLGILTSLLIIFVEGLVYQNLEAKQVNAYFWTLVGTLAFLSRGQVEGSRSGES
jgi:hypothetical protein